MAGTYCFCTLAAGQRYRAHAQVLAQDLQQYAPGVSLVILTDKVSDFSHLSNVLAFEHQLRSVKGYHDKRFVLEKALILFETCIFVDSDVRIIGAVPETMEWTSGITARAGCDLLSHIEGVGNIKEIRITKQVAQRLNISLEKVQWLHEFMFVMKRQGGLETKFFQLWQTISYFFELQGIYHGECYSIGLAAAKVGIEIDFFREDKFLFFKDKIERVRIKNGQSNLEEKQVYFDLHKQTEFQKKSIFRKVFLGLKARFNFYYRLYQLRKAIKQDPDFSKIFM